MIQHPIKFLLCVLVALISLVAVGLAQDEDIMDSAEEGILDESSPLTIAHMRALDKITARVVDIDIRNDEEVQFGTLTIRVRTCRSRPPEETPETFAFVEVDDLREGEQDPVRVFTGWMMASSPALNALEHAVYDIWVISCTTSSPDMDSGNNE